MDKCWKKNTDQKIPELKSNFKTSSFIKFNLEKQQLQCFMSSAVPLKPVLDKISEEKQRHRPTTQTLGKLTHQSHQNLNKNEKNCLVNSHSIFNNKLLFMQYGAEEMYIDSTKSKVREDKQSEEMRNSSSEGEDELVASCVRVITEQTDNSSNPMSARYNVQKYQRAFEEYGYPLYMQSKPRNRRSINKQQSGMYHIDVDAIQKDGRTTLMLRHIPNKYTRDMILEEIDRLNFKKKYDFFYLPIDYRNQCNVGYAFINFIHTKFIEEFYDNFHHKKWVKFNSQKICQVCYARIQGTAQLLTHFKDSNVIQQKDKKLRPLIDASYTSLAEMVERQKTSLPNKPGQE